MTPQEHYERAEALLAEGTKVVEKIRDDADRREVLGEQWDLFTRRMDEHGKQAMGIWAQAQVHATLAAIPVQQVQVEVLDTVSVEVVNAGGLR